MGKLEPSDGFSYASVLVILATVALGAQIAYQPNSTINKLDKEDLLIQQGGTYIHALESYYYFDPAQRELPRSLDELL